MTGAVYIETSIISYLVARPSRDVVIAARQAITLEWWTNRRQDFELFISALVEDEISSGDSEAADLRLKAVDGIPSLSITDEAQALANRLIERGAVPIQSVEDALHIAIAAAQGIDYLLTWNFKHINNAQTKARIAGVVEERGYVCPVLCSPEELGE